MKDGTERGDSKVPRIMAAIAYTGAIVGLVFAVPALRAGVETLYLTDLLLAFSFATIGMLVSRSRGNG
ncbi:MAG TPA: hypothetical protein VNC60_10190, partial [Actinomycetota bacterium]|nr:hypothetical protein [Actinomycetota bacterium]